MAEPGLTSDGHNTPTFVEVRAFVVEDWKAKFGDNAQTAQDTPDGLFIDFVAKMLTSAWQAAGDSYSNSFFRTANKVALNLILDQFARRRLEALASTGSVVFYGSPSITILAGAVALEQGGDRYVSDVDAETVAQGDGGPVVVRILSAVDGDTYAFTVGATESTYVATPTDGNGDIAKAIAAELETDNPTITSAYGGVDEAGIGVVVLESLGASVVAVGGSATTPANQDVTLGARVAVTAEETGPKVALATTFTSIGTPIAGILGVCSTTDNIVGRDEESNDGYRIRHLDLLGSEGGGSMPKIRARLLSDIEDLESVRGFENRLGWPVGGLPANSYEMVWLGPAGTEKELEVANLIYQVGPAGIEPYGSIVTEATDPASGDTENIGHSRATELYLHLDVVVTAGESYPSEGDPLTAIQQEIATYLQKGGGGELKIGDDFYGFSLGAPVALAVPIVGAVANIVVTSDATATPGDTPTLTPDDISVDTRTILRVDSSRIDVTLAP